MTTRVYRARRRLARFVLELTLLDYSLCHFRPSVLATTVLTVVEEVLADGHKLFQSEQQLIMDLEFRQTLYEMRQLKEKLMLDSSSVRDILKSYAIKP